MKKSYDNPTVNVCMNGNVWGLLHVEDVDTLVQTGTHTGPLFCQQKGTREHVVCRPEKGKITWSLDRKQ